MPFSLHPSYFTLKNKLTIKIKGKKERERSDLNSIAGEIEGGVSANDMAMVRSLEVVCRGSS